jgi:hypothetical protein
LFEAAPYTTARRADEKADGGDLPALRMHDAQSQVRLERVESTVGVTSVASCLYAGAPVI